MEREDWRDLEAERLRRLRDRDREDFGQADYSNLYGYDPRTRSGYKAYDDGRPGDEPRGYPEARRYDDYDRRYQDRRRRAVLEPAPEQPEDEERREE